MCGRLWPEDCQTCGRALGGQQPALCVDDHGAFAVASLHHPKCRRTEWNDSGSTALSDAANLSWTSRAWASLPLIRGERDADPCPFVLVNPGLEMVFLTRSADGWEPELAKSFPAAGLQPVGEVAAGRPVSGFAAELSSGTVAVRQLVPPFEVYTTGINTAFAHQAREKGGLLFGVTHLVNPATPVTGDQMDVLMLTGSVLMGWVSLRSRS